MGKNDIRMLIIVNGNEIDSCGNGQNKRTFSVSHNRFVLVFYVFDVRFALHAPFYKANETTTQQPKKNTIFMMSELDCCAIPCFHEKK